MTTRLILENFTQLWQKLETTTLLIDLFKKFYQAPK